LPDKLFDHDALEYALLKKKIHPNTITQIITGHRSELKDIKGIFGTDRNDEIGSVAKIVLQAVVEPKIYHCVSHIDRLTVILRIAGQEITKKKHDLFSDSDSE
jgi:hypothetical protein